LNKVQILSVFSFDFLCQSNGRLCGIEFCRMLNLFFFRIWPRNLCTVCFLTIRKQFYCIIIFRTYNITLNKDKKFLSADGHTFIPFPPYPGDDKFRKFIPFYWMASFWLTWHCLGEENTVISLPGFCILRLCSWYSLGSFGKGIR